MFAKYLPCCVATVFLQSRYVVRCHIAIVSQRCWVCYAFTTWEVWDSIAIRICMIWGLLRAVAKMSCLRMMFNFALNNFSFCLGLSTLLTLTRTVKILFSSTTLDRFRIVLLKNISWVYHGRDSLGMLIPGSVVDWKTFAYVLAVYGFRTYLTVSIAAY
jgi:hypothetical protein